MRASIVPLTRTVSLVLERRTIETPVDDERSDQRGYERQNNGDGHSEQRRLHGKASFVILKGPVRARRRSLEQTQAERTPLGRN